MVSESVRYAAGGLQVAIVELLHGEPGLTATAIAKALGRTYEPTRLTLGRMAKKGLLHRDRFGGYTVGARQEADRPTQTYIGVSTRPPRSALGLALVCPHCGHTIEAQLPVVSLVGE